MLASPSFHDIFYMFSHVVAESLPPTALRGSNDGKCGMLAPNWNNKTEISVEIVV
jgi:hypothetical protein